MPEPNPEQESERLLELIEHGELDAARKLLFRQGGGQSWFELMGPIMESAGGRYEQSDKLRAIWCYEQAQACYMAEFSPTSGAEAEAMMSQIRGGDLGRKIWLLKS